MGALVICAFVFTVFLPPSENSIAVNNNNNNNNNNMCYMEGKCSTSDPDCNIIYGSNSKVTVTESKET